MTRRPNGLEQTVAPPATDLALARPEPRPGSDTRGWFSPAWIMTFALLVGGLAVYAMAARYAVHVAGPGVTVDLTPPLAAERPIMSPAPSMPGAAAPLNGNNNPSGRP